MQAMLVDAFDHHSLDGGSSPPASTKQSNTKFLSTENLAGLPGGVFVVLSVESVLKDDI